MKNQLLCFIVCFMAKTAMAQSVFYDINTIQQIEINFSQSNWDYQLDTAKSGAEGYIMATTVSINGSTYDSVGVKYKGNSSYDATYTKNPLHIAIDEFKNQSYQGITDVKLGNGYADPSQIREVLAYNMLSNYMDCPQSNFAQVYINGVYYGLYSNAESINKDFCSEHFNSSNNTFIKCNPIVLPGPTTKSNLKLKVGLDSSAYFNFYEIKSNQGWNDLIALCDSVTNHAANLSSIMDVDKVIWMLAFNNVLVNLDSYSGVFCQNYYLYKDNTGHYNPVVWDLNMAFGGFPFSGNGATGTGSLTVTNMQQMPLTLHATDQYWPLINAVLSNSSYKKMYVAHMRTMLNEFIISNQYLTNAATLHSLVDTAVLNDTNSFYSYAQFQNGLTTNYNVGSYTVPGIANLMSARASYLQSTSDFLASPPIISNVLSSDSFPNLNTSVTITAQVTNASGNAVFLGYRLIQSDKFSRIPMWDDGLHNDGAAGDNVYGVSVFMNTVLMEYYIYAENTGAGVFSPERAEHEFYTLLCNIPTPTAGQVVINEFLANNVADTTDENGDHDDWIELYNSTNDTLSLFGLFLSDSYTNPKKFPFPQSALILPNSYLIVWADDQTANTTTIHCNFKLSLNGERLLLSNNDSLVLDSISYGPQAANVSFGRCPNGSGAFTSITPSTFAASNCAIGINENSLEDESIKIFPNPAASNILIYIANNLSGELIRIQNMTGQTCASFPAAELNSISVSDWDNGVYCVRLGAKSLKFVVIH